MKPCPSCGEESPEHARFCLACGTAFPAPEAASTEVRKVVTIVFADVTGSTALGERLDPEALRRVMGRYFDEMAAVIERHGGTVEKFIGDAVMSVFGIPRLHEDDAIRAVRAADGMRAALEILDAELRRNHGVGLAARIGINTGEVVAGDPSTGQRLVTGDAVNVAARLEQAAGPGEILLGDPTFRLVKDAVEVEQVEPLELKGKAETVVAHRLLTVRSGAAGHARRLDSPMVGRAKELELLEHALDRAVTERTSHLFTLLGSAGVGKSRLVSEFLTGPASAAVVLRGRCLSYGDGIAFYPLAEVVQQAAQVEQTDDVLAARGKLASLLAGSDDVERVEPLVAGLLSWTEPGTTEDAFWAVRKLLEHLARELPVVVVFDDVHWAEPTFLDLVEHLADWTRDAPLLLLCVGRPELLELRRDWAGGKLNATSILLEPLDGDAASTLVDNLLGAAGISPTARSRILEAAEGNPLFVEEMLGMLIDDGLLRFEDCSWRGVEDLADLTVPPTIQLLLAARLDRLDADERAVIGRGAIEGKVFHSGAVATLSPEPLRPHVPTHLLALARKELIRPERAEFAQEDAFRFRHLLIRDAAYHAMPKEHRADLHERFASWLEAAAGERLPEYEEILGYHLEQAYRYRTELGPADDRALAVARAAAEHLLAGAARAEAREDARSARNLLTRSVALAQGRLRSRALLMLAIAQMALHDYVAAGARAEEARAEATRLGDRILALRAGLVILEARAQTDPTVTMASTREATEAIRRELEELGDDTALVEALALESRNEFYAGRTDRASAIAEEILERSNALAPRLRREARAQLSVGAYFGSTPLDEALVLWERVQHLAPTGPVLAAMHANGRFALLAMAGRTDEALEALERADQLWQEVGDLGLEAMRSQARGEGWRYLGRVEHAERTFRRGVAIFDELGETGFNSTLTALHADVLGRLGRFEEAETEAARSRTLAAQDDFASQAQWRLALARVLSARGEHGEALRLAEEAIQITEPTDYLALQADAYAMRGLVLRAAGRTEDARAAFEEALARYERKGAAPDAQRTRDELEAL